MALTPFRSVSASSMDAKLFGYTISRQRCTCKGSRDTLQRVPTLLYHIQSLVSFPHFFRLHGLLIQGSQGRAYNIQARSERIIPGDVSQCFLFDLAAFPESQTKEMGSKLAAFLVVDDLGYICCTFSFWDVGWSMKPVKKMKPKKSKIYITLVYYYRLLLTRPVPISTPIWIIEFFFQKGLGQELHQKYGFVLIKSGPRGRYFCNSATENGLEIRLYSSKSQTEFDQNFHPFMTSLLKPLLNSLLKPSFSTISSK